MYSLADSTFYFVCVDMVNYLFSDSIWNIIWSWSEYDNYQNGLAYHVCPDRVEEHQWCRDDDQSNTPGILVVFLPTNKFDYLFSTTLQFLTWLKRRYGVSGDVDQSKLLLRSSWRHSRFLKYSVFDCFSALTSSISSAGIGMRRGSSSRIFCSSRMKYCRSTSGITIFHRS